MNNLNAEAWGLARISELLARGSLGSQNSMTTHGAVSSHDVESVRGLARSMHIADLLDQGSLGGLAARVLRSTVADADVALVRKKMREIEASEQRASAADTDADERQRPSVAGPVRAMPTDVEQPSPRRSRRGSAYVGPWHSNPQPLYTRTGNTLVIPRADNRVELPESAPAVLRIVLGSRLRKLRESRGITREAASDAIRGSDAKIGRLEQGRIGFKEQDLRDLLTLYGVVDSAEREEFLHLARRANEPGWWAQFNDLLPRWLGTYLGLEQAANVIHTYELGLVPSLLQTADYARAMVRLRNNEIEYKACDEIERRVAMLTQRQQILTRAMPPALWAVIDESVLRRSMGGAHVRHQQLQHLIEMAERPNIRIQILCYSHSAAVAVGNSFSVLSFPEADLPAIVYTEQLNGALYLDRRSDVERYEMAMKQVGSEALPVAESIQYLKQLLAV
ncbi:helix-turn-helix domain-containing protein [Nocardia niwae]|uniref:helix-turn-helix domain-containing protein n=1 Tax=Nocardia niwae TaxID=626084 RepID=UPI0034093819